MSAAGWKALDDGTAGFDTLLSSRPIGLHRPSISLRPGWPHKVRWLRPASGAFDAGLMPLAATLQGGTLPGSLFGCGHAGHLFPPAISRGCYQPPSSPRGSAPYRATATCNEQGTSQREEEYRRNPHSAARKGGISGILDARERKKGSRRSLSIAARRGGGTDCPRSRVPLFNRKEDPLAIVARHAGRGECARSLR